MVLIRDKAMQINLSPVRSDESLAVSRTGDALTINGTVFDFSKLPEGATLQASAVSSEWFTGPIERINGVLNMTLRLPHGPCPSAATAFPQPISLSQDGPVELPK